MLRAAASIDLASPDGQKIAIRRMLLHSSIRPHSSSRISQYVLLLK